MMQMTMKDQNEILLRRGCKVFVPKGTGEAPLQVIVTLLKDVAQLGYTFSPDLIERLQSVEESELVAFHGETVDALKSMLGAKVNYAPMYPNFPKQVMDASEAELYLNAIMHYLGDVLGIRILPGYEKAPRPPLADTLKLKVIDLAKEDDFPKLAKRLMGSKTSISATDKGDLVAFVRHYKEQLELILPLDIPHKENLCFVTGLLLKFTEKADLVLVRYFKTATDILRLAVSLSDGDVSLAENTKFRSFKRPERRLLLSLLDRCQFPMEDLLRFKKRWIRLGERLHPGEYRKAYPKAAAAFYDLRNDVPFKTFNHKVEMALLEKRPADALSLLKSRPGDFARRLDHLLRLSDDAQSVLSEFASAALKVATPVLLQVFAHFRGRNDDQDIRAFFPKGNVAKVVSIPHALPKLDQELCEHVVNICQEALIERFRKLDSLGKVYLDDELKNYLVPFSQRSASKSLRTLVRGSSVALSEGDTIRFFLWWKEGQVAGKATGRVDIDLSSVMYDKDWNYKEHISYTNLKSSNYRAVHSGDITSAPKGACEFIDLDIPSVLAHGGRYVVMSVLSYTKQPFSTIPECHAGWQMRKEPGSGEIFEPKTVVDKIDLGAETKVCIPVILDLQERRLIWADLALKGHPNFSVNFESNKRGFVHMARAITSLVKTNLYDLFELHARARGERVEDVAEAETVFSLTTGITPFDIEQIAADFL
jgi:hypothetical protein